MQALRSFAFAVIPSSRFYEGNQFQVGQFSKAANSLFKVLKQEFEQERLPDYVLRFMRAMSQVIVEKDRLKPYTDCMKAVRKRAREFINRQKPACASSALNLELSPDIAGQLSQSYDNQLKRLRRRKERIRGPIRDWADQ